MGVQEADLASDKNVVFFEHLFLGVKDMVIAHAFYEEALGLVYDPSVRTGQKKGVGVSWLNIGDQQFHIDDNEDVSRTPGPVRLQLPSLDLVQQQLQNSSAKLSGTQFKFKADVQLKHIAVTDPWGQVFDIRQAESSDGVTGGRIDCLVMPCHQRTSAAIALFYKLMLEAETTQATNADGNLYSEVHLGHGTTFQFQEDPALGPLASQTAIRAYEGWHCAVYVRDFEETYDRVVHAKINYTEHPYKDKAYDLDSAKQWNQFRFQDIIAVDNSPANAATTYTKGQLLYRFGHEVRSLQHRRCPKILLQESRSKTFRGLITQHGTPILV